MRIFRAYLRRLLQDLEDANGAIPENEDTKKAKELMKKLIEDTKKDIEDS